jgi:hypothetical protein
MEEADMDVVILQLCGHQWRLGAPPGRIGRASVTC